MEKDTPLEQLSAAICALMTEGLGKLAAGPEGEDAAWSLERRVRSELMQVTAAVYGMALERMDRQLCASLPEGVHVHDIRKRAVAACFGDVSFRRRRCCDRAGSTDAPSRHPHGPRAIRKHHARP